MKTNIPEFNNNNNFLGSLNNDTNNDPNPNGVSRLEVLKSLGEKQENMNSDFYLQQNNHTPPYNKKVSNHLSTGQLNGYHWGNGFPLFTPTNFNTNNSNTNYNPNTNYNSNNFNNNPNTNYNTNNNYNNNNFQSIFSNPNFFDYESNKNRSKSQEFFSPELNFKEPISVGITPLKYPSSFRNSWDNGLDFLSVNNTSNTNSVMNNNNNLNTNNTNPSISLNNQFKTNQNNNSSPKTSFFTHNLSEIKEERPKSPNKMTPSSPNISPFQQWAMNKSKKIIIGDNNNNNNNGKNNNNSESSYGSNERYADTDFSEHVEHPSRTLFVRNLANNVDLEKLKELFEKYGPIRNMYTQAKYRGFVMISFFDIRHAKAAKTNLQSKRISGKKLDIHFALPKDTSNGTNDKVVNQGTLVVFNLDATITNDQLIQVFGKYGEIKDIRETPNKKSHKFIEFFDVRDAQKALIALNKTQIGSKTIKIEPSRPGGSGKNNFRRNSAPISDNSENNINVPQRQSMNLNFESPTYQPSYKFYSETNSGSQSLEIPFENPKNRYKQNSLPQVNFMNNEQIDQNIIDINLIKCNLETRTTLMIRNIPNKYTQALLLESIDLKHKSRYDFFYLPIDFGNKCNMGYAFINLISPLDVISFYELWNDCRWSHFNSDKVCSISFARIQGRTTLEQHFLASSVMTEDKGRRPMFFDNGIEVTDQLIQRERNYHLN